MCLQSTLCQWCKPADWRLSLSIHPLHIHCTEKYLSWTQKDTSWWQVTLIGNNNQQKKIILHKEQCNCQLLILSAIYLTSTHLARGRQDDSPDWLRYSSGKGAGFFWQNSSKSLANLSGRMMTLACWYPITHKHTMQKNSPPALVLSLVLSLSHILTIS